MSNNWLWWLVVLLCLGVFSGDIFAQEETADADSLVGSAPHSGTFGFAGAFSVTQNLDDDDDTWDDTVSRLMLEADVGFYLTESFELGVRGGGVYFWSDNFDGGALFVFGQFKWLITPGADVVPYLAALVGATFSEDDVAASIGGGGGVEFFLSETTSINIEYLCIYSFSSDDSSIGNLEHRVVSGLSFYW
jgi:hypothetical protein